VTSELSMRRVLSEHLLRNWSTLESLQQRTNRLLSDPSTDRLSPALPVRQQQKRLTPAELVQMIQLYRDGTQVRDLASQFGVHRHTISQRLTRMGVPLRRHGLRDEDADEAAQLYAEGWSLVRLGEKYDCDHSSVRNTLLRHGYQLRPRPGWEY
jgi:lambda repressor-like predicted transcriptional regulator